MGSTSDITLQAPGISNFSIPAPMTFPNVFGAAPGSQLNFLSFDHTTGRLVIEGTATVSEDGLSVSTDPGTGVTHPGWHGLTPPGGCGGSGGPPPPSPDEVVTEHDAVALHLHIGDFDFFGFPLFKWNAPPLPPGQDPPPPPPPGCGVPRHRSDPGPEDAFLAVFIQIDGPLARFAEPVVDGLPLSSQAFTFAAGTNEMKRFDFFPQRYDEMFGAGGFQKLIRDQIYGAKIKITEVRQDADGNRTRDIYTYYSYRWVKAIYAPEAKNKAGNSAAFYRTLTSSSILGDSLIRKKFVDHFLPGSVATTFDGPLLGSPFDLTRSVSARGPKSRRPSEPDLAEAPVAAGPISGSGLGVWDFDPFLSGNRTANFDVEADGLKLGSIVARGTATNPTTINVNLAGYKVELKRVILSLKNVWTPQGFGPGSSGDDDGNGSVGNEEYGWPGSDDKIEVVYDYGGAVVTATTPGPDGNLATTADNVERDVLDYRIGGAWRSGGGRTYRWWRVVGPRFKAEFAGYMPSDRTLPGPDGVLGTNDDLFSAAQLAALDTLLNQKAQDLKAAIQADYNPINSRATGYTFVDAGGNVTMVWQDRFSSGSGAPLFGSADFDADDTKLAQLFPNAALPLGGKMWALAENINLNVVNDGGFAIAINVNWTSNISFAAYVANTVSHEIAHTFGINDAYSNVAPTGANTAGCRNRDFNCKPFDIMMSGGASDPDLTFRQQNIRLLQAAMGIQGSFSNELEDAVKQYRDAINLPGGVNGVRENEEDLLFGQMAPPIASNPEIGLLRGDDIFSGSGDESDAVGEVAADGPNGAVITADYAVLNTGFGPLTISTADFADGTKGFSVAQTGLIGTPVAPGETATLRVVFDPAVDAEGKLTDTLVIESDAESTPVFRLPLTGDGLPPHPVALVEIGDTNNLGGVPVSGGTAQIAELAFITNDGTGILMVTDISLVEGLGPFSLLGVPGDLATNPIELARGDSASFGIQFDPNKVGLERALGDVTSNDPDDPMVQISAVGTGLDGIVYPEWGNDYIAIETPLLPGAVVLRELSDDLGNFEVFLPPQEFYHMAVFDPETGLVSHSFGTTARSGRGIDLTSSIFFDGSVAPDADFDGLPDDVEFAIGTTATNPDTDGDGLSDFTEIKLGLDPFGGRAFPTGVIASLALGGQAREVVVEAVTQNGGGQTAYVAAGTQGLAIVDASQFNAPVLLEQIGLPGNAADVAVDTDLGVAAVAAGGAGLHLVDVSNPVFPALLDTVALPNGAVRVEVFDGLAYVASGPALVSIDLVTSELVQTLGLGGGNLTDIAREGTVLHTMDANRNLRAVDISGFEMQARGQLQMPHGGGKLFVGNGIAYAVASNNFFGGFATASVADPDNIILISGSDASSTTVLPKTDIVANGSGLGLLVGTPPRTTAHALNLMSVINSADTAVFLTSFGLPQAPNDVFVASGIAYVADGSAGLQVVNYLPFDNLGQRPEITIVSQLPDLDLGAPGIQVTEGSSIPLQAQVSDDVQVIRVELLVDGEVVATDVSFPFDLSAIALSADPEAPNVQVRARATDMGGNSALSNILDFDLVPDTFAPTVVRVEPANGQVLGRGLGAVRVRFSEPLAAETVTAANFLLRNAAGTVFPPLKVQLRNNDLLVQTTYPPLPVGVYTLFIKASAVTDRAGNPLGVEDVTSRFTLVPTVTYYGYNPNNQGRVTLVGWTDGSIFEVVDLDNQTSVTGGTLDRFESIVVALGGVRHFKVDVTLPVLATLGYDCCNFGGSFFYPAIDGRSLVGREFIVRIPVLNTNNEFIIFAYEDSQVTIRDAAGTVVANRAISGDGFYATTGAPLARRVAYQVESTGNIAIMSNSRNAHTAVPSSNGSDVGSEFLFGTRAWSGYAVAAIFAYTDATVVGTDLVSGLTAFERTLAAGDFAHISGLAESKFRVMSTGNIGVWAGSTEGGNAIQSVGDDLTMNTGNVGLEFVIHTQSQGAHLFAFRGRDLGRHRRNDLRT